VPVKLDDRVVGLISEEDLRALTVQAGGADPDGARVHDLHAPTPYVVELSAPLGPVLLEMARRHVGSAIVLRSGRLAGIITESDICRALGELLVQRFGPGGGRAA
jgi:CBS domain-containing protein